MARPLKKEIRAKIRRAVVQTVLEHGMGSVSVGAIAKQAAVSPGTIYLHHENKEAMLQTIYLQIKTEFHALMVASRDEASSAVMLKRMWFDMFAFVSAHPRDFLFIEDIGAASVLTMEQKAEIAQMGGEIRDMIQSAVDDGTLTDLPVEVLFTLMIGPALLLAKQLATGDHEPKMADTLVAQTFARVWLSVTHGP